MSKSEIWKAIPGWEGLYSVSNLGNVKSLPRTGGRARSYGGGILTPVAASGTGYLRVMLSNKNIGLTKIAIHRLVLMAFRGLPKPGMEACHKNGVRTDNRLVNLRWGSRASNQADRKKHGTYICGEQVNGSKLTKEDVRFIRRSQNSHRELARIFGVECSSIYAIKVRKNWKHVI